eukprot:Skav220104  [mRNA]  locus=scaffold7992:5049:10241:- [translate_table: standard]
MTQENSTEITMNERKRHDVVLTRDQLAWCSVGPQNNPQEQRSASEASSPSTRTPANVADFIKGFLQDPAQGQSAEKGTRRVVVVQ